MKKISSSKKLSGLSRPSVKDITLNTCENEVGRRDVCIELADGNAVSLELTERAERAFAPATLNREAFEGITVRDLVTLAYRQGERDAFWKVAHMATEKLPDCVTL